MKNVKSLLRTTKGKITLVIVIVLLGILFVGSQYIHAVVIANEYINEGGDDDVIVFSDNWLGNIKRKYVFYLYDKWMSQEVVTEKVESNEMPTDIVEDTKPKVEVLSTSMEDDVIKTTVKNNTSYVITYIRIDVFFYDENSVNIGSDWTNTSNKILPNGQQTIELKYFDIPDGAVRYSVVVSDVSYE